MIKDLKRETRTRHDKTTGRVEFSLSDDRTSRSIAHLPRCRRFTTVTQSLSPIYYSSGSLHRIELLGI